MLPKATFAKQVARPSTSASSAHAPRSLPFIVTSATTKPAPPPLLLTCLSKFLATTSSCPNRSPDRPCGCLGLHHFQFFALQAEYLFYFRGNSLTVVLSFLPFFLQPSHLHLSETTSSLTSSLSLAIPPNLPAPNASGKKSCAPFPVRKISGPICSAFPRVRITSVRPTTKTMPNGSPRSSRSSVSTPTSSSSTFSFPRPRNVLLSWSKAARNSLPRFRSPRFRRISPQISATSSFPPITRTRSTETSPLSSST